MKKRTIFILGFLSLLLISCLSIYFFTRKSTSPKKVEYEYNSGKLTDIRLFGDQNQYVMFKGKGVVVQNYLISLRSRWTRREPGDKDYNVRSKGDYAYLVLRDLRTPDFKQKEIDLYEALKVYGTEVGFKSSRIPVSYEGRDYLSVTIGKDAKHTRQAFLDLETGKFQDAPAGFDIKAYEDELDSLNVYLSTSLWKVLEDNFFVVSDWRMFFASSRVENPKLSQNINFVKDYPDVAKRFVQGEYIYPRKGLVTPDSLFQDLRHWFAPIGQDKLEVTATDEKTGEQTVVNTYQEYQAWREAHK